MIERTSGLAEVFGDDIGEDMERIRNYMGVCPQHNILFDDLTVEEHLELFGVFKGIESEKLRISINEIIKDVDLESKRHYLSKHLSGG